MRVELLEIENFNFINISEYSSDLLPNKHGTAFIGGTISGSNVKEYLSSAGKLTRVWGKAYEQDNKVLLFCGIVSSCKIKSNGDVHYMKLGLSTQSVLMDITEHIRTFQKEGSSYRDILNIITKGYKHGAFIAVTGEDKKLTGFMCQYKETDWEYINRLACSVNTVIYPDYKTEGEKFYMVLPDRPEINISSEYYEIGTDSGEEVMLNTGKTYYKVSLRETYDIGQKVIFLRERFGIVARLSRFEYSEIVHDYILMYENDIRTKAYKNQKLIGAVLFARVTSVENELVKVRIDEDENEDSGELLLNYATVYSSPDTGSWYCMPEIGDRVMVRFPDAKESTVYIQNAIHIGASGGRNNPDIKFLKNKEGKEIRLSPDSILITDNNGSSIEIKEGEGIHINSSGMVFIGAKTEVLIESSNSDIKLISPMSVQINQNGTQIEMSDGITSQGSKIYLG